MGPQKGGKKPARWVAGKSTACAGCTLLAGGPMGQAACRPTSLTGRIRAGFLRCSSAAAHPCACCPSTCLRRVLELEGFIRRHQGHMAKLEQVG